MNIFSALQLVTPDNILKVIGVLAGAATTVQQIRQFRANSRSSIKADLELLQMLDKSDEGYALIKAHTENLIRQFYAPRKTGFVVYSQSDFIVGLILLPGFSIWTAYLLRNGFSWWSLLTAFFAFAGLGALLNGLDPKNKTEK